MTFDDMNTIICNSINRNPTSYEQMLGSVFQAVNSILKENTLSEFKIGIRSKGLLYMEPIQFGHVLEPITNKKFMTDELIIYKTENRFDFVYHEHV